MKNSAFANGENTPSEGGNMDLIKGVAMGVIISLIVRQIIETRSAENTSWPTVGQENQSGVYA